jgi:hypothetical protein
MASIRIGCASLISIVEAAAVCLDKVSLLGVGRTTRRFTAAAFLRPEPTDIGSNGSALSCTKQR